MKKKKILYIDSSTGGGGASKSLSLLIMSLDKSKYEPVVLLGTTGPLVDLFKQKNIKTYIKKLSTFAYYSFSPNVSAEKILNFFVYFFPNIVSVYRIIKKEKIGLVHINTLAPITSGVASRLAGAKVIWHIREIIPDTKIGRLQRKIIEFIASDIIAVSKEVKKQFDKEKTILVYNGVNPQEFKPNSDKEIIRKKYGLNKEETIFTHIGQLSHQKGSFVFLKAAKLLIKSGYNARFFIIGGPIFNNRTNNLFTTKIKRAIKYLLGRNWKEKLENFARDEEIIKKVIFTGYRNDIANFISLSNAIIVPNLQPEGFNRVLIETGALRKPVITTNILPFPEIITNAKTGLLVEPNNPVALAEAMKYIIDNPREASRMGENGYQNVINNFHIDTTHSKIRKLYEKY